MYKDILRCIIIKLYKAISDGIWETQATETFQNALNGNQEITNDFCNVDYGGPQV